MRKWLSIIMVVAMCIGMTACEKKAPEVGNANPTESPASEEVVEGSEQGNAVDAASTDRYERFLNNEIPVYMNQFNPMNFDWEYAEAFEENKGYSINEFLHAYFNYEGEYSGGSFKPKSVSYAYIDCGDDGTPELAIKIEMDLYNDYYTTLMVIKDIDDKMQLCSYTSNGYRSFGYINPYGMLHIGGSGGAAYYYNSLDMIDASGNRKMVYELETTFSPYALIYPDDGIDYFSVLEDMGIEEYITIERYSFEPMGDETYDEYLRKQYYTYHRQEEFSGNEMDDPTIYEEGSKYVKFFNMTGYSWYTPDKMQELVDKRYAELGITDKMLTDDEPEWIAWSDDAGILDIAYHEIPAIIVENPSSDYYLTSGERTVLSEGAALTLDKVSETPNEIIDTENWFSSLGLPTQMDRDVISDRDYTYYLRSTSDDYIKDVVDIVNYYSGDNIATLSFQNYIKPDNVQEGDMFGEFTDESVQFIQSKDGILYVSVYHRTYASAASHNAYIVALDMFNDYQVIWKSEPLTCNSDNFLIMDDFIVCGYGFTAEPDYIYILDRHSGKRMDTIKVKTSPDYFYYSEDESKLYVRTYDTDYTFNVSWG